MKILHVITTLDVGGAEVHLLSQVEGQCARGHQVRVAWLKGQGRMAEEFRAAGARVVGRLSQGPALAWRAWPHLRWAEIVHSHLLKADAAAALLAPLAGRRRGLVSSKHNDEQVLLRPLVAKLHSLLARLPGRTIVLSDHVGEFFASHGGPPKTAQTRIYYGIDPRPFELAGRLDPEQRTRLRGEFGWGDGDVLFTCVARFAEQKAHDVLLRGFDLARGRAEAPLRLLLVGDDPFGDRRERTEALARELGLGGEVAFAGIRRDVPTLLAVSDAFVLPSRWEGLGLVFLEAMAAGLPVVATRVSAVPEVVVDGETGVLVPVDDPQALAGALLELAADPERRRRMGAAGRARLAERFGLERMIEETLEVYRSLLGT